MVDIENPLGLSTVTPLSLNTVSNFLDSYFPSVTGGQSCIVIGLSASIENISERNLRASCLRPTELSYGSIIVNGNNESCVIDENGGGDIKFTVYLNRKEYDFGWLPTTIFLQREVGGMKLFDKEFKDIPTTV